MKNNKGFALTEILILSAVVIGVLTFMYIQFKNINRSYQYSFKYDTVEGMYLANNIINYINEENYDTLVETLKQNQEAYLDITSCNIELFKTPIYCEQLIEKSEIKQILFTEENLINIKNNLENLDQDLQEYIKKIKTNNSENDYRIIIKYNDDTFTTLRFNKGNSYVKDGLIVYLDGMNNTGNGHSNDTNIWKDLSGRGNDATLYNNPTWSNNSLTFDGQTNYGRLESTANMSFPNGITIETRVKILAPSGRGSATQAEFLGNWDSAGGGLYYTKSNEFKTNFYITNGYKEITTQSIVNLNEIYTITLTYDNNTQSYYVNGILAASESYNTNVAFKPSSVPIAIGGNPSDGGVSIYANVEFQNVLIYDRALTETEILRNYQTDISRY